MAWAARAQAEVSAKRWSEPHGELRAVELSVPVSELRVAVADERRLLKSERAS